jgi:DNA-binding NtrC family response regulator
MSRILLFEPDVSLAGTYKEWLDKKHQWVLTANSVAAAMEMVQKQPFHLCVWSVDSMEQVQDIYRLKDLRPGMSVVVLSSSADPSLIVKCMRAGASHFCVKSGSVESFLDTISETLSRTLAEPLSWDELQFPYPEFIGRHPRMLEIFQLILSIKDSDSTVLITGESGTGKEVVARAIHSLSPRKKAPWIAINCGAIPANLLESELFGHVKGAFTGATQNRMGRFQMAGAGTLFLDEISDLSLDLQAKILRAIQHRVFDPIGGTQSVSLDARIIAATNQDLETSVAEKRFRQDLFYRLNVIPITLPPLRSRKSDIPFLVKAFIDKFAKANNRNLTGISEEAMTCLMQYYWPGNIRELENLMERVVVLKREEGIIELKDLPTGHFKNVRIDRYVASVSLPEEGLDFNEAVNEFENELILQALQKTAGNKNRAATLLNLNRTTLVEKLKRKGLVLS